jgi:repressor LexA
MKIGEKISLRRKQLDLTLEEVGQAVGVSKTTVRKWENGVIENMKRDKIVRLSKILDMSIPELMGWENELFGEQSKSAPIDEALVTDGVLTEALSDLTDKELDDILKYARYLKATREKK